ncbi:MAG: glycoside hydrolase family 5 protein [Bacteroidales bacterium]|jgi:endoglucanase|nr:glycoside hydrolase family 5 protein [Bacteroidales bacterium]
MHTHSLQTPVARYGKLQVNPKTGYIYGSKTGAETPVQVKGVSFGWNMYPASAPYFNAHTVHALVHNMKAEILRAPMGYASEWGYAQPENRNILMQRICTVVEAAISEGVYVIIDWHSHHAHLLPEAEIARNYLQEMAQKYGKYDNVIFEIYNEPMFPNHTPSEYYRWETIKPYAEDAIAAIRRYSDNLVVVGTPYFSQQVGDVAGHEILDANTAYVLHFYTYNHRLDAYTQNGTFREQIQKALAAKLPLFVSEWGTTHSDGGQSENFNTHSVNNSNEWMLWCDKHNISWCAWQMSHRPDEKSAWFNERGDVSALTELHKSDFNESGQYIWDKLETQFRATHTKS